MQIVVGEILINYEVSGADSVPTILILHGWKNSLKNWEGVANELSQKHRIILMDLPGMGNSSLPNKQPFDTYDYAEIVSKFIEKLKLKDVVLLGHSFGGKVAVVVASESSGVKKLILVDISGIISKSIFVDFRINLYKAVKLLLPFEISKKIAEQVSSEDYRNAGNLKDSFKKIVTQDISESAKKIKIPTLIVWGEDDKEVSLGSAKKLENLITNSTLRIVWKAGHHPHLEKLNKFIEILEEFI